jgi:hypothetical protein
MAKDNYIKKGVPHGDVASALLNGEGVSQYRPIRSNINMAALPKRAWEMVDETIERVAKTELLGIADLNRTPGVPVNFNGMSASTYTMYRASEMTPAHMAMSPDTRGEADILDFDSLSVPLPVTVKDFWVNTKQVSMAATEGVSLATYATEEATYQVSWELEDTLFNGNFKAAGSNVWGYTTFPSRQTYSITTSWSTADPEDIFADVNAMVTQSMNHNHYGPWVLYIPWEYSARLNEDYTVGAVPYPTGVTIGDRIMRIPNLQKIEVSKHLANNNVVLVEMSQRTVKLLNGIGMTAIDWEPPGSPNWNHNFKVITMAVPLLIADYQGQCGIVHGSV